MTSTTEGDPTLLELLDWCADDLARNPVNSNVVARLRAAATRLREEMERTSEAMSFADASDSERMASMARLGLLTRINNGPVTR